ncbi:oxidoreductase [Effusibacillus consociatus]|uniref:Oxidoreductase n=1 Tax=Effusibacillus consociatus TaxID=1117041 RepID=A0ABV9Q3X4_9BACL
MASKARALPIAFLTGTSSGFGLLTSVALAKEGYQVIASMRNLEKRSGLEEAAHQAGVADRIEIVELDVTDFSAIDRVMEDMLARYGRIDLLINNAGYAQGGFIEEVSMEDWRCQFETNFFGVVAVTKAVLPSMRERGSGTIVNISSISGQIGMPVIGPYAASKFALEGFSESLRLEVLPFGVRVILVEPGSYKTEIWSKGFESVSMDPDSPYSDYKKRMLKKVNRIVERAGDPNEVVKTILHAVRSPYPELRYPVGKAVKTQIRLKQLIPWKWIEKKVASQFGFSVPNGKSSWHQ